MFNEKLWLIGGKIHEYEQLDESCNMDNKPSLRLINREYSDTELMEIWSSDDGFNWKQEGVNPDNKL